MAKKSKMTGDFNNMLKNLRKSVESDSFDLSQLNDVKKNYDTGCYALNRIISGDFHKGLPSGRVTVIYGESQGGKSLFSTSCAAQALNDGKVGMVFLLDSEGGVSKDMYKMFDADLSKIELVPIDCIEELSNKVFQIFDFIKAVQSEDPNFDAIIILDSLGALVTRKTVTDIEKDEQKLDRGLRARLINDFIKAINMPALRTNTTFILLNHIYDDPNAMYQSAIKNQPGGRGIQFMGRIMLQCSRALTKNEDKEEAKAYVGTRLRVLNTKNFLIQPFNKCEVELDFSTGYRNRYTGLMGLAIKYGFVQTPSKGFYQVPTWSDKKIRESRLMGEDADEIWGTFIDDLNEAQRPDLAYGSLIDELPSEEIIVDETDTMQLVSE